MKLDVIQMQYKTAINIINPVIYHAIKDGRTVKLKIMSIGIIMNNDETKNNVHFDN